MSAYLRNLRTKHQVFEAIHKQSFDIILTLDPDEYIDYVKDQLKEAKAYHPWMHDATDDDFEDWANRYVAAKINAGGMKTPPTSQEFWRAVYDYGTLEPNELNGPKDLITMITSGIAGPYTIGKLWGCITLKVLPVFGALRAPDIEKPGWSTTFSYAPTDSCAIYYPDGHPYALWNPERLLSPSSKELLRLRARDDDNLRRFAALGWVIMETSEGNWEKTGHVLVIDMDDREVRHRQPWLILASQWPSDGDETEDFMIHAEEQVMRDNSTEEGVFPGDNNRTPICRIVPYGRGMEGDEIVLTQLGEDFDFAPERKGGHRDHSETDEGPALARVMEWYWDPEAKQEVCYTRKGRKWMRYNPQTKEYFFPAAGSVSDLDEESGFFGELRGLPNVEIPDSQWKSYEEHERELAERGYEPAVIRRGHRTVSTTMGF
ncbi:MAG: hypothetical protein Q9208_007476 [Pyrenodesmia sp. 3 TL-2023]